MTKILIIEDEADIRDELALLLENEGYLVQVVTDFAHPEAEAAAFAPDLILLDLGLPGRDGFLLCRAIRRESKTPIIFVTSRDSSLDELKALSLGGDDYVTKPYNVPVLLARIRAVLRRGAAPEDILSVNGLRLDLTKGVLESGGRSLEATKNEIRILVCLMRKPGQIVSRAELIDYLWDNQIYIDDNALSVNITRLRAKLEELGLPGFITTKRGLGYKI